MAVAYLTEGSITLADAAFSDASGFAAATPTLVIDRGTQTITTELDKSALTEGVNYLHIRRGFTGNIGSEAGPLLVDADNSTTPHIWYDAGGGRFYYRAAGDNNLCTRFLQSGLGSSFLQGGTITTLEVSSGDATGNGSVVITNLYVFGGTVTIANNATAITAAYLLGGNIVCRRAITTMHVAGNANVVYDPESNSTTTINQYSGTVDYRATTLTNLNGYGGTFSISRLRRDATFTNRTLGPDFNADFNPRTGATPTFTNAAATLAGGPRRLFSANVAGI